MDTNPSHCIENRCVTVLGAGLMGHAIGFVFADAGWEVTIFDRSADALSSAQERVAHRAREVDRPAPAVRVSHDLADSVAGADLVVEAVAEDLSVKTTLLSAAMEVDPTPIYASNTSVIPIADISRGLPAPHRFIGCHWWNPPHLIDLVEVVRGPSTEECVVSDVIAWLEDAGKVVVVVNRDVPGFIGNRLQFALWREAMHIVESGIADATTVDTVVRETFGRRLGILGPLANADYIGLELTRGIMANVLPDLSRASAPPVILEQLLADGKLGARTGEGFLDWAPGSVDDLTSRLSGGLARSNVEGAGDH